MIRPLLIACAALALLLAAPSRAADEVTEARAHFDQGSKLYRAGRFRDAIVEFDAAYRIKPHGAIHHNVAQCREKLEQWPGALQGYQDYLREVPEARDRAAVRATMGRIERRLAAAGVQALLVYTDPPGAAVRIDGKPRGRTPYHVTLAPGLYRVALALNGFAPEEQEVEVNMAGTRLVDLVLQSRAPGAAAAAARPGANHAAPVAAPSTVPSTVPAAAPANASAPASVTPRPTSSSPLPAAASAPAGSPAPATSAPPDLAARAAPAQPEALSPAPPSAPPPPSKPRVAMWVAGGVAVAAGVAGAAYGVSASRKAATLRDGSVHADAAALARDARQSASTANLLYGISGVAAAAGVTLFFLEGKF